MVAHAPKSSGRAPPRCRRRPRRPRSAPSGPAPRPGARWWRRCRRTPRRRTPAAAASDSTDSTSSPSGRYRSCRWQCESIQRAGGDGDPAPEPAATTGVTRSGGGTAVPPSPPAARRVATPGGVVGQPAFLGTTVEPQPAPDLGAGVGHGRRRQEGHDPQRLERAAEDLGDVGAGLGLPGLGRLELGVGLVDESPRRLEGDMGLRLAPRRRGVLDDADATARSRLSGSAAGPTPSHFDPTTVVTRARRFPRLLARSALYRAVMPS